MEDRFETRTVSVKGIRTTYVEAGGGHGVPMILIHGGGAGASGLSNYRKNIGPLSKLGRVIVPDLPGWGESENSIAPGSIYEALCQFMIDFMNALGIEKANFVGNSLGGGITLKVAVHHPQRANKLVLMGPGGALHSYAPMPSEGNKRMAEFYMGTGPSLDKLQSIIDLLVYDPSQITPDLMAERLRVATRPDILENPPINGRFMHPEDMIWRDPLHLLTHETLIIWGREDRVIPMDGAIVLTKIIPNAQLHIYPKCGHWAQWERADEFNQLVANFMMR